MATSTNPFPGMNPYLEEPAQWEVFHHVMIAAIGSALNRILPLNLQARIGARVYLLEPFVGAQRVPDVAVVVHEDKESLSSPIDDIAFLNPKMELSSSLRIDLEGSEMEEWFIEIVHAQQPERLVAAIELLSPANKRIAAGRKEYQDKQQQLLRGDAHLLEIDLLRGGTHVVAAPHEAIAAQFPRWDYVACLYRAQTRHRFQVWPIRLPDALPSVSLPLTDDLPEVALNLAECLQRAFADGALDRGLRYQNEPPSPLLPPDDALWLDNLLREKGRRPSPTRP